MRLFVLCVTSLLLWITACTPETDNPVPSIDTGVRDCQHVSPSNGGALLCVNAPPTAMLLQTQGIQVTTRINGANITLDGTVYIDIVQNQHMIVATLEGVGIVGAYGSARILQPGSQTIIPIGGTSGYEIIGTPGSATRYDAATIASAPLDTLSRPVELAITPQQPVQPATPTPEPDLADCTPRDDWTTIYTIVPGDNLSSIASNAGISLNDLQNANCITNPDRIFVGQELRLPATVILDTPAPIGPTNTPSAVLFRADSTNLVAGNCTTLRWDIDNVTSVALNGEVVDPHSSRQVCPTLTTTYRLVVMYPDAHTTSHQVVITVTN